MANEVILQEGHPVDENIRPIKVGGKATALETAQSGDGARIVGDLEVTGSVPEDTTKLSLTGGTMTGGLVMDSGQYLTADLISSNSGTGIVSIYDGADFGIVLDASDNARITLYSVAGDNSDYVTLEAGAGGTAYLSTNDSGSDSEGHLTISPDGDLIIQTASSGLVFIDSNNSVTTATTTKALFIDLDRSGDVTTGTDTAIGLDLDVTQTGASGGTITSYGLDIDVIGDATIGTNKAYGATINVSGATVATGLEIDVDAGTSSKAMGIKIDSEDGGTDFINVSSANALDKFTINTIEDGETTLTTTENSGGSTAHLNMVANGNFTVDAEGDISLDAQGGNITLLDGGSTYTPTAASDAVPLSHLPYVLYSQFQDDLGTAKHYLPLKGYFEQSFSGNEPAGMIAPFNMKLQKIILRCSEDISGATWKIGMWAIDSGSTHAHHHTTGFNWKQVTGGAADTNATFDFTGTVGLAASASGGSNAVTAGQWIDFAIQSDTDVTSSNAEFWITMFFIADLSNTI